MVPPHHFVGLDYELRLFLLALLGRFVHNHEFRVFVLLEYSILRRRREAAVLALEVGRERPVGEQVAQAELDGARFVDGRLDHDGVIDLGQPRLEVQFVLVTAARLAVEHQVDSRVDRLERQELHAEHDHVRRLVDLQAVGLQVELAVDQVLVVVGLDQTPGEFGGLAFFDAVEVAAPHYVFEQFARLGAETDFGFLALRLGDSYDRLGPIDIAYFDNQSCLCGLE